MGEWEGEGREKLEMSREEGWVNEGEWRGSGMEARRQAGREKGGMLSITAVYFTAIGTRNINTCNKPHNELTQLYL